MTECYVDLYWYTDNDYTALHAYSIMITHSHESCNSYSYSEWKKVYNNTFDTCTSVGVDASSICSRNSARWTLDCLSLTTVGCR